MYFTQNVQYVLYNYVIINVIEKQYYVMITFQKIKTLLTDLNAIIPKCYSSNHIKMQSCIAMNLVLIRSSLKQTNSNAITLVNMTITAYINIIRDVKNSVTKLVLDIRIFSKSIIIRTNSCAKNAPVDNLISTNNSKLIY